ncbi:MAG: glycosyltransferase [Methanomassiliicoccus sp.]|nr:glycosyltransferase [Methanomassiliicoccus sp.]
MNVRVFMEGPQDKTGGVSNHMRYLKKEMTGMPGLQLITYDSSLSRSGENIDAIIHKMYGRFIGFPIQLVKRRKEYDIVHTQSSGGMPGFITAMVASVFTRILGKEQIFTFHYSQTEQFVSSHHRMMKLVLDSSSACILVSNRQKEAFGQAFGSTALGKIHVISNGFNPQAIFPLDREESRAKLGITAPGKLLVNIANLERYKAHRHLIEAMRILCQKRDDVHLCIVGHGSQEQAIRDQIENSGLSDKISLIVDYQTAEGICLWHNSADIFVLSSCHEGNPTVMFECLACGIPFVGTKVGGVPQIVSSDRYGLLCERGDPAALAEELQKALEREWDRSAISTYAADFHWRRIAEETVKVYQGVLEATEVDRPKAAGNPQPAES